MFINVPPQNIVPNHPSMAMPQLYAAPARRLLPHPSQLRQRSMMNPQIRHSPPHNIQLPQQIDMQNHQNVYRNIQNDFSRGFEFDYDFLPTESSNQINNRKNWDANSTYSHYGSNQHSMVDSKFTNSTSRLNHTRNSTVIRRKFKPKSKIVDKSGKFFSSCHKQLSRAGILFTAILYSVCDCLYSYPSIENRLQYDFIDTKLLDAYDGSRLDLTKMRIPHDRLMTEESIENLEFEILENRAQKLDREENQSFFFNWKTKKHI